MKDVWTRQQSQDLGNRIYHDFRLEGGRSTWMDESLYKSFDLRTCPPNEQIAFNKAELNE